MELKLLLPKKLILSFFVFFHLGAAYAQDPLFIISGNVTDAETNTPLPGVSILIKGTTSGTITDANGNFTLEVPAHSVITAHFIGYEREEIEVENKKNHNISLVPSITELDEVVIVAYGKQARELVSGSITKLDPEIVNSTPSINAVQALEGKVAGLSVQVTSGQPGDDASIYLRGGSSPNPNSGDAPLFVIDGVIRSGLGGLNPDDIESVQVLKDAAATSIYGARAANGIILVTTKTGKGSDGGTISIDYSFGIEDLRKTYDWTSAADYIKISRLAAQRGGNLAPGSRLAGEIFGYSAQVVKDRGQYGYMRNTLTYLDDLIAVEGQAYVANLIDNQGYATMKDPATGRTLIFKDNNYNEVIFNPAQSHEIDLGMSGSGSSGNYYVSLGYVNQEGIYLGTDGNNFSLLANGEYNVKPNFKINAGATFQLDDWVSVSNSNNELDRSPKLPHTYRLINDDGTPALGESTSSPRSRLHELYYVDKERDIYRMTYRFGADWTITDGLSFKPSASYYRKEWMYSAFQKASPAIPGRSMRKEQKNDNQLMINGLLDYNKIIGDHNFDLLGGINYTMESHDELIGDGANAPTDLISTINASETEQERAYSIRYKNKLLSYFGRLDYNFAARYLLSASFRVDGSSSFAKNKKWGVFPAVSLGWNIHNESFWKSEVLNRLKLRGSLGQAGSLSNMRLQDTQGEFVTTIYHGEGGVVNNILPNYDLSWETTTTLDVGLDIGFLDNRISLFVDFYNKLTSDRIISKPLPAQTGFASIKENYGSLQNRGIEIELGADVVNKGKFNWRADFNFAFNRTTIKGLPKNGRSKNRIDGGVIYAGFSEDPNAEIEVGGLAEGERVGGIWAYDLIGVYADNESAQNGPVDLFKTNQAQGGDAIWRDVNGDNIIDEKDLVFVGWLYPDIRGGMVNALSWNSFALRFAVDYALGHTIANGPRARSLSNARNNVMTMNEILSDAVWQQQGDQGKTIPRYDIYSDWDSGAHNYLRDLGSNGSLSAGGGSGNNTLFYEKGDYLAFREVSISYNLPKDLISKIGFSQCSISLGGYNLGYLTDYSGLTPEIYDGLDEGSYPRPGKFLVSINAKF